MKRKPFKIQIDPEHENALHDLGAPYNLTGNAVLAAAAAELVRVKEKGGNLWHALGRIAVDDAASTLPSGNVSRLPRGSDRTLQAV